MTKQMLTQDDIQATYAHLSNLGSLMQTLETRISSSGEVICQFRLNGMVMDERDEKRLSEVPLADVSSLEIESETPTALLFGLLENWTVEIPKLQSNAEQLAGQIKFSGINGHLKDFVDFIDSCRFLMESLMSLNGILSEARNTSPEWQAAEKLTAQAIGQATKAFETKDFVLLADVLEYDFGHVLQIWLELIQGIHKALKEEYDQNSAEFSKRIFKR